MAKHPAIMMKFAKACDQSAGKREIMKWVGKDLVDSKPLFPDADDAELSTIYEIYLKDDCRVHTESRNSRSRMASNTRTSLPNGRKRKVR